MRNATAREKLARFEAVTIEKVAELIRNEQARQGLTEEQTENVARIIVALMNGISIMRALNADAVDDAFLETAMAFMARPSSPCPRPLPPELVGDAVPE